MPDARKYWPSDTWPGDSESPDITRWNPDPATGLLLSKVDAANRGYTNSYYPSGALRGKQWARGLTITYELNPAGDLTRIDYSDSTPDVVYDSFDRRGLPRWIGDGSHTLEYDTLGRLLWESDGTFTVERQFDGVYGLNAIKLKQGGNTLLDYAYRYDTNGVGRLNVVTAGDDRVEYAYLANSDLLQTTTSKHNGSTVLTASRTCDFGYRLNSISNLVNGVAVSAHKYQYDDLDRRTKATLEDGSYWNYGYNDRDELISGRKYWPDTKPVAGLQYLYAYDSIGNRIWAGSGGDQFGANLRYEQYTANQLNQYTAIANPGFLHVTGAATNNSILTVNNNFTTRKGEFFSAELRFDNTAGPVYPEIDTVGVLRGAGTGGADIVNGQTNHTLLPPRQQALQYDADGNLINDGLWAYRWDGENRLIEATNLTTVPAAARLKLAFAYDFLHRRISKAVCPWDTNQNDWATVPASHLNFACAGWNLLAELNATNNAVLRSYTWGLDLSRTTGEAGGIGGLLRVTDHSTPQSQHFAAYDGNGNGTALINASDGATSARYDYSPFGQTVRTDGLVAQTIPFQFSTKYLDTETRHHYYGRRYYSATTGRWASNDPTGEDGGLNLLAFVKNDVLNSYDSLGTTTAAETGGASTTAAHMEAKVASQARTLYNRVKDAKDVMEGMGEIIPVLDDLVGQGAFSMLDPDAMFTAMLQAAADGIAMAFRGASPVKGPNHHVGTIRNNKAGAQYTKNLKDKVYAIVGLAMVNAFNTAIVPGHSGPHRDYNDLVYKTLLAAMAEGAPKGKRQTAIHVAAAVLAIGVKSQTPGNEFHDLLTKEGRNQLK